MPETKMRIVSRANGQICELFSMQLSNDGTLLIFPRISPSVGPGPWAEEGYAHTKISVHPSPGSAGQTVTYRRETYKDDPKDRKIVERSTVYDIGTNGFLFPIFARISPGENFFINSKPRKLDSMVKICDYNSFETCLSFIVFCSDKRGIPVNREIDEKSSRLLHVGQFWITIIPWLLPVRSTMIGTFRDFGNLRDRINREEIKSETPRTHSLDFENIHDCIDEVVLSFRHRIADHLIREKRVFGEGDLTEELEIAMQGEIVCGFGGS
jgi:hypothetical protein